MPMFVSLSIKLFFLLTPFFALSMFLTLTENYETRQRKKLAVSTSTAVALICLILFFLGNQLFSLFGITVNSFRIGAGVLLFLSGINLVQGKPTTPGTVGEDISVVPLAIPVIVGPATTGTILVMGAELSTFAEKISGCLSMLCAVVGMGAILLAGSFIEKALGARGITILSRLTGLILSALAAQMIMTGIQGFLNLPV